MNTLGVEAERIAAEYLKQQGLLLLTRNYSCRHGEIDLIMRDGKNTVFVEVRLRKSNQFGGAVYSITPAKQQKIIRTAQHFLAQHGDLACRFDVILMQTAQIDGITWIKNAFDA